MQVEIFSDVVCPWCYIGKRRFEQALERFPHAGEVQGRGAASNSTRPHRVERGVRLFRRWPASTA